MHVYFLSMFCARFLKQYMHGNGHLTCDMACLKHVYEKKNMHVNGASLHALAKDVNFQSPVHACILAEHVLCAGFETIHAGA